MNNIALLWSLLLCLFFRTSAGIVIGIDFGSEWMKVGIVGGKAFEVVLNEQSTRKTPSMVAFDRGDFLIGGDAQNLLTRSPKSVYAYTQLLLGRSYDDPYVRELQHLFLYDLQKHTLRDTFNIPNNNISFAPEDIAALLLTYAKDIASKLGHGIKDCAITVPVFWTQAQRQAVLDGATLAGLHVLSLINENSAVGLNYGMTREFTEEGTDILFYDMGATSTKASLVHFKSSRDSKTNKTSPHLQVLQVAWDVTLGGKQFDYRLAQYFVDIIKQQNKLDLSFSTNPRAFARILKEAQRTKEILSANSEARVMIEGLTPEFDFKTDITRQKFEELTLDLIERAAQPIASVLKSANLNAGNLGGVEIIGGGLRIPRIQEELSKFLNRDLDKHLNGDESSVMGATFYAATMSASFKVKEFKLKDITPFVIGVTVKSETGELDKSTELFKPGNRLGSKKSLTFPSNENFTIQLNYLDSPELPASINHNLGSYLISGVPTLDQYNYTGKPQIHATCRLNSNGMVVIESVEAEITVLSYPQETTAENKTEDAENKTKEGDKTESGDSKAKEGENSDASSEKSTSETKAENSDLSEEAERQEQPNETSGEDSKTNQDDKEKTPKVDKIKKRIHRVPLKITPIWAPGMSTDEQKESTKKLYDIRKRTEAKKEREKEKNNLESYIYQMREKLQDDLGIASVTTEEQREKLLTELSETEDWLYGDEADGYIATDFRSKLRSLKTQGDAMYLRLNEITARPEAVEAIRNAVNGSLMFVLNISDTLQTKEGEVEDVVEACNNLLQWVNKSVEEQSKLQPHETPAFTSQEVYNRWKIVEAKIKTLLRRPKKKVPKQETTIDMPEDEEPNQTESDGEDDRSEHAQSSEPSNEETQQDTEHSHDEL